MKNYVQQHQKDFLHHQNKQSTRPMKPMSLHLSSFVLPPARKTVILFSRTFVSSSSSPLNVRLKPTLSPPPSSLHFNKRVKNNAFHPALCTISTSVNDNENKDDEVDTYYMRHALDQAHIAFRMNEVPIGAVLVNSRTKRIISRGHNSVESSADCTEHAEMNCLRAAMKIQRAWRLIDNFTLYTTLEPCPMCLSAAALARVSRIVYAAPDLRLGACGSFVDLHGDVQHPFHRFTQVKGGVLEKEAAELMRDFFKMRRKEQKSAKKK